MKKKIISIMTCFALVGSLVACTSTDTNNPSVSSSVEVTQTSETTASGTVASETAASGTAAQYEEGDVIKIGVSASITGELKLSGDYVVNGAKLAEEDLNAAGGILGKKVEIVFADEGDNVQSSVTAASKLLNDPEILAVVGPSISTYCIAADQVVKEAVKPYFACGSSANIPALNNLYMHQIRATDDKTGQITAKVMAEYLNMKNPAILYINDTYGVGMMEQTVAALANLGITVPESNCYATNVDEKQYTNFLTQIMNSGVDGLLAVHHTVPASLVMVQADDMGLDITCIGSNTYSTAPSIEAAQESADGWYSCTDWTESGQSGYSLEFINRYHDKFNETSDKSSVYAYDSIMLIAEACRLAGTTDPEKVNEALLNGIKDFQGVMATYNSNPETRSLSNSLMITLTEEQKPKLIERYSN